MHSDSSADLPHAAAGVADLMTALPLAHIGHWAENLLFVLPILVIGLVIWYSRRQEQAEGIDWDDDESWDDPRLRDDEAHGQT